MFPSLFQEVPESVPASEVHESILEREFPESIPEGEVPESILESRVKFPSPFKQGRHEEF